MKLLTLVCLRIHKAIYDKSNLPFNFENKYFDKLWDLQNRFFCTHRPIKRKLTSRATQLLPHTQISRARKTSKIRAKRRGKTLKQVSDITNLTGFKEVLT